MREAASGRDRVTLTNAVSLIVTGCDAVSESRRDLENDSTIVAVGVRNAETVLVITTDPDRVGRNEAVRDV